MFLDPTSKSINTNFVNKLGHDTRAHSPDRHHEQVPHSRHDLFTLRQSRPNTIPNDNTHQRRDDARRNTVLEEIDVGEVNLPEIVLLRRPTDPTRVQRER